MSQHTIEINTVVSHPICGCWADDAEFAIESSTLDGHVAAYGLVCTTCGTRVTVPRAYVRQTVSFVSDYPDKPTGAMSNVTPFRRVK